MVIDPLYTKMLFTVSKRYPFAKSTITGAVRKNRMIKNNKYNRLWVIVIDLKTNDKPTA